MAKILRKKFLGIAIIDYGKRFKEKGQYVFHKGGQKDLEKKIAAARKENKEIRYYYKDLRTSSGEALPCQIVVSEIPPGSVQLWHVHEDIHEAIIVNEGRVIAVDATETVDILKIRERGVVLEKGDMVVQDPGVRHTICNDTGEYVVMTATQVKRIPVEKFTVDRK